MGSVAPVMSGIASDAALDKGWVLASSQVMAAVGVRLVAELGCLTCKDVADLTMLR
jgi:hypothetical protein